MQMHTPSSWTFWLSVVLIVLAVIGTFVSIRFVSIHALWVAVIGWAVPVFGCTVKTA